MSSLIASYKHSILHIWQNMLTWEDSPSGKGPSASVSDNVDKHLAILGYDSFGRQVTRSSKAVGTDVLAFTAKPRNTAESRRDHGYIVPGTGVLKGENPSAWFSGLEKRIPSPTRESGHGPFTVQRHANSANEASARQGGNLRSLQGKCLHY